MSEALESNRVNQDPIKVQQLYAGPELGTVEPKLVVLSNESSRECFILLCINVNLSND